LNAIEKTKFKLFLKTYHVLSCNLCVDNHNLEAEASHYWTNQYTPHLIYEPIWREVGFITEYSASLSEGAYLDTGTWAEFSGQRYEATPGEKDRFSNYGSVSTNGLSIWHIEWDIEGEITVSSSFKEGIPIGWKEYFSSIWRLEFEDAPINSDADENFDEYEFSILDSFYDVLDFKLDTTNNETRMETGK